MYRVPTSDGHIWVPIDDERTWVYKLDGARDQSVPLRTDADILVTMDGGMDLTRLARAGRRLRGLAQTINLGADIFLADEPGEYLGRICHYRECHPRAACRAQHCGRREHLNDDLHVVTLSKELLNSRTLSPMAHALELTTRPADDIGINPDQGRTQRTSVEVAVVGDPAANARIPPRQWSFGPTLPDASRFRPMSKHSC